ncbi:hypothetical protein ACSBR1_033108 [Camellia fascicularis]
MIAQWCKDHSSIKVPEPLEPIISETVITEADEVCLNLLLEKISSSSISDQKKAARELRRLTTYQPSFQALFVECKDNISRLLEPLVSPASTSSAADLLLDPELQEDLITLLHNVSVHEKNKRPITETPIVIRLLMKEEGHPLAMKDVLKTIPRLCEYRENQVRAVQDGAVRVLVKKIVEEEGTGLVVVMLLTVLTSLSSQQQAVEKLGELGAVPWLLKIMRTNNDETNMVNCAAILLDIIKLFTDSETFRLMGKEHALVVSNHKSNIDWLVGWLLAQRSGCLGSALAVMKKSSKFLPVIGWSMWFSEYLFLERSWAKDERTLKSGLQQLQDFPLPFWLALFVEGTRFTQAKLEAAQEYAALAGLPVPRNVLIPRTKGFVSAVSEMRSFVPAIYEVTVAVLKSSSPPTMLRLFKGKSSVMHVHLKRHLIKDLPETDDAVAQWCRDMFVAKDKLLDEHIADDIFSEQEQDMGRYLLGMSAHFWGRKILPVDLTSIHMEGYDILGNWVGHCYGPYADIDPILSVEALNSYQEDFDTGPRKAENATELKKELQRQIKPILDEDDYEIKATDEAMRILSSLKELKVKGIEITNETLRFVSSLKELKCKESASYMVVPEEFKCPISREIMHDPVVLATGQTCDRCSIMEWLDDDHWLCPQTAEVLSYTILSPNHLVREMITQWCKDRSIKLAEPRERIMDESKITEADKVCLFSLLKKMFSSSICDQKRAARELRRLTRYQPSFRALFVESKNAISGSLEPLVSPAGNGSAAHLLLDPELQEDLITLVHNISVHEKNKRPIARNPIVVPLLIETLKTGLTIQTKSNAAASLFTLATFDCNKVIIGNLGVFKPLIDLVEEGHPVAMKDVLLAIYRLCENTENRVKAVQDGAVRVLVKKIMEEEGTGPVVSMLLTVLTLLSSQQQAVEEMGELGAVPWLLRMVRTTNDETNMVNCSAILLNICRRDHSKRKEMWEAEIANRTITRVAVSRNPSASQNGNAILEKLRKHIIQ